MKIITFDDIKNLNIRPEVCYQWVSEMIEKKKQANLPAKISLKPMDGVFCNVMPCIIPFEKDSKIGGVKIVTRYPERVPSLDSLLLLMDVQTGEVLAIMDADWITAMRTGAVAAHSIRLFAKKGFSKITMIGLGNTARSTLLILEALYPNKIFDIKLLKHKEQEVDFAKRFSMYPNLRFSFVDKVEDAIKGADVVISGVTYFDKDICPDSCFDEGVLVVPIHTREFTNCDLFFDKIYADDYAHVCNFKNFNKFKKFAEVSDVVNGLAVGRENDQERILAYNIGIAIHDMNFAMHAYRLIADSNKKLLDIDLKAPSEKFWI